MPREGAPDSRLANACLQLGLQIDQDDRRRLLAYLGLIERWNRVYNLTALREPAEMFTHHLLDCLAIVPSLDRWLATTPRQPRLLDVGSGAGLPGVVLALLRPEWQVTCIEAVAKKAAFIRQVAAELAISNLEAVHARVEATSGWARHPYDLIISRAFASLADFIALTRATRARDGVWAAMKAAPSEEELAAIPDDIEMFHVEHLEVPDFDAERRLIWLRPRLADSPAAGDHRQSPA